MAGSTALRNGSAQPEDWTVPGSHALLERLASPRADALSGQRHGCEFRQDRRPSCWALARFFGEHIYGALDDYGKFSKKMIIERILQENRPVAGEELLGFGDGFVEIEEVQE